MGLNFLGHMLNESATKLRRCQAFAFGEMEFSLQDKKVVTL